MEVVKGLIIRLRHTGVLFVIGVIVITYIALGFLYWQQGGLQRKHEREAARLSAILAKPLPSIDKLQAEYEEVNLALAPKTIVDMANTYIELESASFDDISDIKVAAIVVLVGIAAENGIDVDETSGNFYVPMAAARKVNMGGGLYEILSFSGVRVQGDYDNVMAFISDLDSGKTLNTMVLKTVATSEVETVFAGEESSRRAEYRSVASAVEAMIDGNGLAEIPNPMSFAGGVATNLMGDDPDTGETIEGFPDITTTPAQRGYSGNATLRGGYVLYKHDKISTDNTTQFETVSYLDTLITSYYYTCEADGTVRQFDGAAVATATEYLSSVASKGGLTATVDVDIYTRP
ncbi:hypothetical protein ACFLWS_07580 [Chloroflexota bacterium]